MAVFNLNLKIKVSICPNLGKSEKERFYYWLILLSLFQFRENADKILPLYGSTVFTTNEVDCFQLTDESGDNVYKFRAGTDINCKLWVRYIREASEGDKKQTVRISHYVIMSRFFHLL